MQRAVLAGFLTRLVEMIEAIAMFEPGIEISSTLGNADGMVPLLLD